MRVQQILRLHGIQIKLFGYWLKQIDNVHSFSKNSKIVLYHFLESHVPNDLFQCSDLHNWYILSIVNSII